MRIVFLSALIISVVISCNIKEFNKGKYPTKINMNDFHYREQLCDIVMAIDFNKINPKMIPWATDSLEPHSESFIIDEKRLKITQDIKQLKVSKDSLRHYFFDDKSISVVKVYNDSLDFNFNNIAIDYGNNPNNIFRKNEYILLRNQPMGWNGKSNQYRFIQLIDLKKLICYELFVNYYSCGGSEKVN